MAVAAANLKCSVVLCNIYVLELYCLMCPMIDQRVGTVPTIGIIWSSVGTWYILTAESYNFTNTLAIMMYLHKHNAYSILNTLQAR